ncbi:hypothetical protein ABH931_007747 [Streptacidiphilus sp. MAP12-33]
MRPAGVGTVSAATPTLHRGKDVLATRTIR